MVMRLYLKPSPHDQRARRAHPLGAGTPRARNGNRVDPNLVLTLYGVERFLYRLSRSLGTRAPTAARPWSAPFFCDALCEVTLSKD